MKNRTRKVQNYLKRHQQSQEYKNILHKRLRTHINRFGINSVYVINNYSNEGKRIQVVHTKYKKINAPNNISMINNTEEMIEFINRVEEQKNKRYNTFIELKDVIDVGYDGLVVLLSIMTSFQANKIKFNGSFPRNKEARKLITDSGFFEYLYKPIPEQQNYNFQKDKGGIFTHASKIADSKLSSEIIKDASKHIWGEEKRCPGVQRILLELMQNTNNHASEVAKGVQHWWMSISYSEKKAHFTFLDYGVGVFKSLENKKEGSKFFGWKELLSKVFAFRTNYEVLRLILHGELHKTVTHNYYRGKGLPGIYEVYKRNQINSLYIITNDVYSNISNDEYCELDKGFSGTFVYFELSYNNGSFKIEDEND